MVPSSVRQRMEREHDDLDDGIDTFVAGLRAAHPDFDMFSHALNGLRRHIYLEAELLFPPLAAAGLAAPVQVMLREHASIWHGVNLLMGQLRGPGRPEVDIRCAGRRGSGAPSG